MFEIRLHPKVIASDIPKLDKKVKEAIRSAIEDKLTRDPVVFGIPLRNTLSPYRKLRVGSYRIIFKIDKSTVYILIIAHRSDVYTAAGKRKK